MKIQKNVTEAIKGGLHRLGVEHRYGTVQYTVNTFMYYRYRYRYIDIIHIYNMYIAEWSVVKDIGEAKLHPFFFYFSFFFFFLFLSDSRDCESFSSDSASVVNARNTKNWSNPRHLPPRQRILQRTISFLTTNELFNLSL